VFARSVKNRTSPPIATRHSCGNFDSERTRVHATSRYFVHDLHKRRRRLEMPDSNDTWYSSISTCVDTQLWYSEAGSWVARVAAPASPPTWCTSTWCKMRSLYPARNRERHGDRQPSRMPHQLAGSECSVGSVLPEGSHYELGAEFRPSDTLSFSGGT